MVDGCSLQERQAERGSSHGDDEDEEDEEEKKDGDTGEAAAEKLPAAFSEVVFGGELSSRVQCGGCSHESVTLEPFYDLSPSIPSSPQPTQQ